VLEDVEEDDEEDEDGLAAGVEEGTDFSAGFDSLVLPLSLFAAFL